MVAAVFVAALGLLAFTGAATAEQSSLQCDSLFNPGCTACTEQGCTAVDSDNGFFLKANADGLMVAERCEDFFGAGCSKCHGNACTAVSDDTWYVTKTASATTGLIEAAKYVAFSCNGCAPDLGDVTVHNSLFGTIC